MEFLEALQTVIRRESTKMGPNNFADALKMALNVEKMCLKTTPAPVRAFCTISK